MYLSRVEIDTQNRRKIRDLSHVGAFHAWVEQSFPQEFSSEERSRKLWRVDRLNGRDYLLIVSPDMPDLDRLEKYGVSGSASVKKYQSFLDKLDEGVTAHFRVVLNPVISVPVEGTKRGRIIPHISNEHQMAFLADRAEKNGFKLLDYTITEREFVPFKKSHQKTIRLNKVTYEGRLVIINQLKFYQLLTEGFGKKKAYGFGLMTVIPERQ